MSRNQSTQKSDAPARVNEVLAAMKLDENTLRGVSMTMATMMDKGLSNDENVSKTSSLKMLPSFVCSTPDGTEHGDHLALDLGGTNFRVLVVTLEAGRRAVQDSRIYVVPQDLMTGNGEKLFDHIADCLSNFISVKKMKGRRLPLGFTFSFPCKQLNLTEATLIEWTKGYSASGVKDKDVGKMLREAIKRRTGGEVKVVAVLNDTTGTLMALAHEDQECQVGIILGTGTNACYMETIERAPKLQGYLKQAGFDKMIVNMEWGAFGDNDELAHVRTEFDAEVDAGSINPKKQTFEKMISGMYLGELVRLVLLKLVREKVLFEGHIWEELETKDRFHGHYVSEIVTAKLAATSDTCKTRSVMKDFGVEEPSAEDCAAVEEICRVVIKRSADLCGAGIATLLNRMKIERITVGIDGSVYRFNQPYFGTWMSERIAALLDVPCMFKLKLSSDGSGRGAALVAAVAARLAEGKTTNAGCELM